MRSEKGSWEEIDREREKEEAGERDRQREKKGRGGRKVVEFARRHCDRAPDIAWYNENMAAT